jgi:error-prone DNA polymerase
MSLLERVSADFACSGLTAGDHPLARLREQLPGVWRACDLQLGVSGDLVRVAGAVICRQRPGTAKGVVFVSLEDETGICNVICHSRFFEENRLLITQEPFLEFDGRLQTRDGVCHVLASAARRPAALAAALPAEASHDFR